MGNKVFHSVAPRLLKNLRLQLHENHRFLIPRITLQDPALRVKGKDNPREKETLLGFPHLIAGHNKHPVIESPAWKMPQPAFRFAIRIASRAGMGHEKNLGPFQAEHRADLRKMGFVAQLQAESQVARAENIETVSLSVPFLFLGDCSSMHEMYLQSYCGPTFGGQFQYSNYWIHS